MPDYSHQIEKYLKGELSSDERHALEKEALRDPFLFDAIEGAESISFKDFLNDLKYLNNSEGKKPNVYLWPLRIAAGILLIAVSTFLILNLKDDGEPLALQSEDVASDKDTLSEQERARDNFLSYQAEASDSEEQSKDVETKETGGEIPSEEEISLREKESEIAMDFAEESAPFAQPSFAPTESLAKTEAPQIADDQANLSRSTQAPSSARIMATEVEEKPISEITVTPLSPELNELVITSPASGASNLSLGSQNQLITLATPEMGIAAFNRYLENNMLYPLQAISNNISGEVNLELELDANGGIKDIHVMESLGFGCDEEAIRLIREGPVWRPSVVDDNPVESRVDVIIQFKLPAK